MQSGGRLKEEGIFRISGSVTRINALVEELNDEATGGERRVNLDKHDVHTVGGAIKRTLMSIEPPLVPESVVCIRSQRSSDDLDDFFFEESWDIHSLRSNLAVRRAA
jgi:hypothetical protein